MNMTFKKKESESFSITVRQRRGTESLELGTGNIGIVGEQGPGRVDDAPGDPVHEHTLVTVLRALGHILMFY